MEKNNKGRAVPFLVLLCGVVAFRLRRQLYLTALDHKGLLLRGTAPEIGLLLLTVGVLLLLVLTKGSGSGADRYEDCYCAGPVAAVGHVAMAAGILQTVLTGMSSVTGYPGMVWRWLGLVSPFCLLLAGGFRLFGKKPFFLLHVVPCLFLMVQVVCNYQTWSGNPQLQNYLFGLLGTLAMALFAYYTAAMEADCGDCRMVRFFGLAAGYLCLTELGWTTQPLLYLGGALWTLTGMCTAVPAGRE